jgi:hypothetical protein
MLLVVPSANTSSEGNSNNSYPFNTTTMRYQQIYASSEFPGPVAISAVTFRLDGDVGVTFSATYDLQINFCHAATTVATISTTFANNIGNDLTTVLDTGSLALASTFVGSPNPLDITITFTSVFHYAPSTADLLMEVKLRSKTGGASSLDAVNVGSSPKTSRINATSGPSATTGADDAPNFAGLVTQFTFTQDTRVPLSMYSSGRPIALNTPAVLTRVGVS